MYAATTSMFYYVINYILRYATEREILAGLIIFVKLGNLFLVEKIKINYHFILRRRNERTDQTLHFRDTHKVV